MRSAQSDKSADCGTTTGHRAALVAADPDGRRAPGLHSLGETTQVVSPRHDRALPARVQPL